jgi:precorrin-6B methylase 2
MQMQAAQPSPDLILQIGFGFWASKTLFSAIELEVFSELAKRPLPLPELQARLGLHSRSARDFFDALVSLGFLERDGNTYSNAPAADFYLDKHKPTYLGGVLEMCNHRLYAFWGRLTEALRTGRPQNEAREGGVSIFEALYSDPARLRQFLRAMTGISRGSNRAIARLFPWAKHRTFADIGTAQGDLAVQIAVQNPHLKGIGFDLPEVAPIFEEYAAENGVTDRLRFQPGDFSKGPLPQVEVITMGHILHDWDLETKQMLIAKAHQALPKGGALIVYEAIIDDERRQNIFGLLMSLNMLIETHGGFDYTGADCCGWMQAAGFRETRVEHLLGPDSMVVGIK